MIKIVSGDVIHISKIGYRETFDTVLVTGLSPCIDHTHNPTAKRCSGYDLRFLYERRNGTDVSGSIHFKRRFFDHVPENFVLANGTRYVITKLGVQEDFNRDWSYHGRSLVRFIYKS